MSKAFKKRKKKKTENNATKKQQEDSASLTLSNQINDLELEENTNK